MPIGKMCLALLMASLAVPGAAFADALRHDQPWQQRPHVKPLRGIPFSEAETRIIRAYFKAHPGMALPLSEKDERGLARGKTLAASIVRAPLTDDLRSRLAPREGFDIVQVGRHVVLVNSAARIIVDVVANAVS